MRNVLKSSFLWQFAGGFALGAAGLLAFHPGDLGRHDLTPPAAVAAVR